LNSPLNTFAESKKKSDPFHVWFNWWTQCFFSIAPLQSISYTPL
jgi:hypothetical protein